MLQGFEQGFEDSGYARLRSWANEDEGHRTFLVVLKDNLCVIEAVSLNALDSWGSDNHLLYQYIGDQTKYLKHDIQ